MKKVFLTLIIAVASTLVASAQDIITKTDGTTIKAKVKEISENTVKYQRYDNLSGPVYTIQIESISSIKYENGVVDSFSSSLKGKQNYTQQDSPTSYTPISQGQTLQDNQLIGLYNNYSNPNRYYKRAKVYKRTAWIGGISLAAAGVIVGLI